MRVLRQLGIGLGFAVAVMACGQSKPASEAVRQQALIMEQQGRYSEAEEAWHAYLKSHPGNAEPYAHLGLLEARQEHYSQAESFYRKALAINPNIPGLRLNLGLALFKSGDLKAAIPEFKEALKHAPADSADAQRMTILIGMSYYGQAEYPDAIPYLKKAAAGDTQNLPLRLALAHSCLWSKQYQCVMDVYHEILTLNAESAEADMLAGEALDEMKDNAGAVAQFRAAVKANPREPNVHFGLGYLYFTQKRYPEAIEEFNAELANDPNHLQSMLYLGDTYIQLNQADKAKPYLLRVAQADPSLALAHLDLGIIEMEEGNNEDALRELTLAAKLNPDDVNVHWRLGRLYRTMGKKDEAKAELDKASSLNKAVNDALYKKISGGNAKPPQTSTPPGNPEN